MLFVWIIMYLSNTLTEKSLCPVIPNHPHMLLLFPKLAAAFQMSMYTRGWAIFFFLNCKWKRIMASTFHYILGILLASKEHLHMYCHFSASTSHNTSPFRLRNSIIEISQVILGLCHISPHKKSDKRRYHSWAFWALEMGKAVQWLYFWFIFWLD